MRHARYSIQSSPEMANCCILARHLSVFGTIQLLLSTSNTSSSRLLTSWSTTREGAYSGRERAYLIAEAGQHQARTQAKDISFTASANPLFKTGAAPLDPLLFSPQVKAGKVQSLVRESQRYLPNSLSHE